MFFIKKFIKENKEIEIVIRHFLFIPIFHPKLFCFNLQTIVSIKMYTDIFLINIALFCRLRISAVLLITIINCHPLFLWHI